MDNFFIFAIKLEKMAFLSKMWAADVPAAIHIYIYIYIYVCVCVW